MKLLPDTKYTLFAKSDLPSTLFRTSRPILRTVRYTKMVGIFMPRPLVPEPHRPLENHAEEPADEAVIAADEALDAEAQEMIRDLDR